MSKMNLTSWKLVIKVIVALATALLGVLGAQEMGDHEA
ncbi:smalltalk protein [Hoylesella enoeca]|nr:smalltalk protein [Hoylesella enoeca]